MKKRVLILTPSTGFGGLIRQLLEDAGGYEPLLLSSPKQALEAALKEAIALIVLDAELGSQASPVFISELRQHAPHAKLVVIPAEDNPHDPLLLEFEADAVLPSPFYLPDLVAAIEQFFGPLVPKETIKLSSYGDPAARVKAPSHAAAPAPAWLQDVSQAARYLTQLSLESASQAALITRGQKVWAYAGELPKQAADELADAVDQLAASGNGADLARFIHLGATKSDYMLYATGLGGEFTLALVFDAQMPFSQMRAQVSELAKALAHAPEESRHLGESRSAQVGGRVTASLPHNSGEEVRPPLPPRPVPHPELPSAVGTGISRTVSKTGRLEPLTAGSYDLHYSCVLIPRLPTHLLEGDLADKLAIWLPQLCLAFALRLESISIQPGFVQWMISMSPDASPESAVHTLETYLSERIFHEFPRLARENPSGQFWAPGFLIVNGALPDPAVVAEYIQQTRSRQGLPR